MPGKSTATQDSNYNGVKKAKQAAQAATGLSKKQLKKQAAQAAQAEAGSQLDMGLDGKSKTTAKQAHVNVSQTPVDETPAYSSTGPDASTKATTEGAQEAAGESKGLLSHLKKDLDLTKDFLSDVGGTLSGDAMKAEIEAGGQATMDISTGQNKFERLKNQGGDYLSKIGRDSKIFGGAKIAGYMVGTSMLLDMLNPFDDD